VSSLVDQLDWHKGDGLLPAIVQHAHSREVLMLGFMNQDALEHTERTQRVTFYSRTKQRLWTKGETSGHYLNLVAIAADCDRDTLLIQAKPSGSVCHTGSATCFGDIDDADVSFLAQLESIINQRVQDRPEGSYTAKLWAAGPKRIAQKVGEEGVEVALAVTAGERDELISEAADLLFHLTLALRKRDVSLSDVARELELRHRAKP
jgi:phosphoribosyl-ATP pyrophosphohydrolase/phosphoribosyl-AMP cyclohydrolase